MAFEKRGIAVISGSATVHKFMDDGTVVLGDSVADFKLGVSGSAVLGRAINNASDITQLNGVMRVPRYVATLNTDVTILNTLAETPSSYNGNVIYLNSAAPVAGANVGGVTVAAKTASVFPLAHHWYFCRDGSWDPDRFV